MTGSNYEIFGPDKRFLRRVRTLSSIWTWGFKPTPGGGFLQSGGYGFSADHELARYAVHHYDRNERHLASWHPGQVHFGRFSGDFVGFSHLNWWVFPPFNLLGER